MACKRSAVRSRLAPPPSAQSFNIVFDVGELFVCMVSIIRLGLWEASAAEGGARFRSYVRPQGRGRAQEPKSVPDFALSFDPVSPLSLLSLARSFVGHP